MVLLVLGWPALQAHAAEPTVPGVSGKATLPDGSPAAGADVCLFWSEGNASYCRLADGEGNYVFEEPMEDDYVVGVELDGYLTTYHRATGATFDFALATRIEYGEGSIRSGIDIRLIKGAAVSGTVRVGTQPLADAYVCTRDDRCDRTDDSGVFDLRVPAGVVKLNASKYDSASDYTLVGSSAELAVADGQSYTLDISVTEGTGLTGTVRTVAGSTQDVKVTVSQVTPAGEVRVRTNYYASAGDYAFRDLAAGTYVVRFSADGYHSQCYGGDPCTQVPVTAGQVTRLADVDLVKLDPGHLTGKVTTGAGQPLAGVAVEARNDFDEVASTTTDAAGAYTLSNLASGIGWSLTFTKSGYGTRTSWVEPAEKTTKTVSVRLFQNGSLTGTVSGDGGVGIPDVSVYLYSDWADIVSTTTDAAGNYSFDSVASGHYRVQVYGTGGYLNAYHPGVSTYADATLVSVPENATRSGVNVRLVKPAAIAGSITDAAGAPLTGWVYLYDDADDDPQQSARAEAATGGTYAFTQLWPGRYTVKAEADGRVDTWLGGTPSQAAATWLTLASGATNSDTVIKLASRAGNPVRGTIRDADGHPAANVDIALDNDSDHRSATSDDLGQFTIDFVPHGTYSVSAHLKGTVCGTGLAEQCSTPTLVVAGTAAQTLDLTLPRLGSVSGAVTLPDGWRSTDWVGIYLEDAKEREVAHASLEGESTYQLEDVPHGTYTLIAAGDGLLEQRTTVTVAGHVTQDITLVAAPTLAGKVTVAEAEDGVSVVALDAKTGDEVDEDWLDDVAPGQHDYQLNGLRPGEYLIGVGADDRWSWYPGVANPLSAEKIVLGTESLSGIDLTLPTQSAGRYLVSGRLTLPAGVSPELLDDPDFYLTFGNLASGEAYNANLRADGTYSVRLPKGNYEVLGNRSEDLGTAAFSGELRVSGDRTYDITLTTGGGLTGRLTDTDGVGLEEAEVWVTVGGERIAEDWTDRWGYWTIGALPGNAKVTLHASQTGYVDLPGAGYTIATGKTIDTGAHKLSGAGRISVRIPYLEGEDGDDLKVTVVVTDLAGNQLASRPFWPDDDVRTIGNIPAGTVLVRFQGRGIATEWWKDAASMAAATRVTVTAGTTAGPLVPKLSTGESDTFGTLSGTVVNSSGATGMIKVSAVDADGGRQHASVAPDGSYSLKLEPGTYTVRAAVCNGYWMGDSGCMGDRIVAWYQGASQRTSTAVTVKAGATTGNVNLEIFGTEEFTTVPTPAITGEAKVGLKLTAAAGSTWNPKPDRIDHQWLRDGVAIAGATSATYVVQSADNGKRLSVTVTGVKAGYAPAKATSAQTAAVATGVLTAATPSVSGAAKVGSTLTASPGSWGPVPVSLAYQWLRDGVAVGGATKSTYVVSTADVGKRISVRVTGSKPGYATVARVSAVTAVVPALRPLTSTPVPTVSGTARVGSTVTAKPGTWAPAPVSLAYQWKRDGKAIPGATKASYVVAAGDLGLTLTVTVTGSKPDYASVSKTSKATKKVVAAALTSATPSISGTVKVGARVTAKPGTWKPAPVRWEYQWLRSGKAIDKATGATYTVQAADKGKKLSVRVTGSKPGYTTVAKTSKAKKVAAGTLSTATPKIVGTAKVGQALTVAMAAWGPAPVTLTYQWYRSGKAISKATKSGYTLTGSDLGRTITVKVTGSKTGYTTVAKTSKATGKVAAGTLVAGTPTVAGSPVVGAKLTLDPGKWGPAPVTLTYQWYRSGKAISKATKSSYTPVATDRGTAITVKVTGTKTGYTTTTRTSSPTRLIT